jgi:cytidylate kinase
VDDDTARAQFLADIPEAAKAWAAAHLATLQLQTTFKTDPETAAMIELLLTVAARGDVVIVGRGAGYLLPSETTVHVRVVAPQESRVAYFAQWLRLSLPEAAVEVQARDQRRAQFLSTLGHDPTDPTGYDMVVNSSRLGIEGTAQFIGWAVRTKQMFAEIRDTNASLGLNRLPGE